MAGWYGEYHHGRLMANGERFDMHGATIAHRDMPMGTRVELENPQTGQRVEAVVTDRGPYHRGRDVDLSYGLAERLSLTSRASATEDAGAVTPFLLGYPPRLMCPPIPCLLRHDRNRPPRMPFIVFLVFAPSSVRSGQCQRSIRIAAPAHTTPTLPSNR